jgi:hypothetical protein
VKLRKYSQFKFGVVLGTGAILASVLCVQCVRTYLYTDEVLVPQQAQREAERQVGALTSAARSAGITDPRALGPVIEHALEAASDRVLWMRALDPQSAVLAESGKPQGTPKIPSRWWESVQAHDSLGVLVDTPGGKALVTMLPFRLPRSPHAPATGTGPTDSPSRPPAAVRGAPYVIELAIPLEAVAGAFEGLRQNLIVGVIASVALLLSLAVIGFHTPDYIRGRYLESELRLAKRVQSDLQPKPQPISPYVEFGASATAADHVGGDFYDIFEAESGKIAVVLGDVSGKGVPAALLVSVLQGAIRSSTASEHERACESINRMLCERTACERFATLFWGVFDPATSTLRYVNAGHGAPMLLRNGQNRIERLQDGGPVLDFLPAAAYSAGTVEINPCDILILYSDGVDETTNGNGEEFGEERMEQLISETADATPTEMCNRIMERVRAFAGAGVQADDRTLLVVRFPQSRTDSQYRTAEEVRVEAVA